VTRVAAVDVGTNSVRLLVAEPRADGAPLATVERAMRITRLGYAVDATGKLDDAALERTLACLDDYAQRWTELGATAVRVTATSAVRDAADRERFFDGVQARTGVQAEVFSAETEAHTAFRGATATVAGQPPWLVVDIGGGSTEFVLGSAEAERWHSRQLGSVRLTERCLPGDPPTAAELADATTVVDGHLDAVAAAVDCGRARTLVGVAGTVTTLAALHLGLAEYDGAAIHGARLAVADVRGLADRLVAMPSAQRAELGPVPPGREDVIIGGALILARVMEHLGFHEVLVSEADILDGAALGLTA
jgi:exopolyphosphatase/guanosine-5'-triphosphate,3'-diphosphate pyrophosphatase